MSNLTLQNLTHVRNDFGRVALLCVQTVLVLIGNLNLVVVGIVVAKPKLRTITNFYIVGLCMADFLYLVNLIFVIINTVAGSWQLGAAMCKVAITIETISKFSSVAFVTILAVDRYWATCRPDLCQRYRSFKVSVVLSATAWGSSLLLAAPLCVYSRLGSTGKRCTIRWPAPHWASRFVMVTFALEFALPLVVIVYCYVHVLRKLNEGLAARGRLGTNQAPYRRVTKMVFSAVIFYLTCWSPYWVCTIFQTIWRPTIDTFWKRMALNLVHLLPFVNCAFHPIHYALMTENFRQCCPCARRADGAAGARDSIPTPSALTRNRYHSVISLRFARNSARLSTSVDGRSKTDDSERSRLMSCNMLPIPHNVLPAETCL